MPVDHIAVRILHGVTRREVLIRRAPPARDEKSPRPLRAGPPGPHRFRSSACQGLIFGSGVTGACRPVRASLAVCSTKDVKLPFALADKPDKPPAAPEIEGLTPRESRASSEFPTPVHPAGIG